MTDYQKRRFLELLKPVYDRLSRYALAITRDEMDGEDLVSATVLQALEQFPLYRDDGRFLNYMLKISSRLHKRRAYRERHIVQFDPAMANLLPDSGPTPESSTDLRIVMDALQTLPERMKETVVLFEVADLSLEEIRAIQGGTLSGVKTRLRRGRQQLAKTLGVVLPERETTSSSVAPEPADKPIDENTFLAIAGDRYAH